MTWWSKHCSCLRTSTTRSFERGEETGVSSAIQTAQFLYVVFLGHCRHGHPRRYRNGFLCVAFPKTAVLPFLSNDSATYVFGGHEMASFNRVHRRHEGTYEFPHHYAIQNEYREGRPHLQDTHCFHEDLNTFNPEEFSREEYLGERPECSVR